MSAEALWILEGITLGGDRKETLRLDNVTTTIQRGITAVVGWSGAGKTSLLNVLAGFEQPDAGDLRGPAKIAWVPQNLGLWPHCTALDHLALSGASPEQCAALLRDFDLSARDSARPDALSGGEQSRLAIARALATGASVLVMDEPLVHVDPARVNRYWRMIRLHVEAHACSLVFATHEPEAALAYATEVICMESGRLVFHGKVHDLYRDPVTPALMDFLGLGNWFEPWDAALIPGIEIECPRCFRPEQIAIIEDAGGPCEVIQAIFRGGIEEVELRHLETGRTRTLFHRPALPCLRSEMRVRVTFREP